MFCQKCGAEIPHGEFLCGVCSLPDTPELVDMSSFSTRIIKAVVILVAGIVLVFLLNPGGGHLIARNKSSYTGCLQSLESISKGLKSYLTENDDFHELTQSAGNGNEICNHITPGAENPADCVGDVPEKMARNCLDYKIALNKNAPFRYEVTGHAKDKMNCGICVTETGYCPTKYSGTEPATSTCGQSCVDAEENSTAVCPH